MMRKAMWVFSILTVLCLSALITFPMGESGTEEQTIQGPMIREEITVNKDGTGDYSTIIAAVGACAPHSIVHVGPGVYSEPLVIDKPVRIVGEGKDSTRIELVNLTYQGFFMSDDIHIEHLNLTVLTEDFFYNDVEFNQLNSISIDNCSLYKPEFIRVTFRSCTNVNMYDNEGMGDPCSVLVENCEYVVFKRNSEMGFVISNSKFVTMNGNSINSRGIYLTGKSQDHWNTHAITPDNLMGGRPITYIRDQTGGSVPTESAIIILGNCKDMDISGLVMLEANQGLTMGYCNEMDIHDNIITADGSACVYMYECDDNLIEDNEITMGRWSYERSWELAMESCDYNSIKNNRIFSKSRGGITVSDSIENAFIGNDLTLYSSISLSECSNTSVSENEAFWGLYLYKCKNTYARNNSFLQNGIDVFIDDEPIDHWNQVDIDDSNTVAGKPIRIFSGKNGGSIPKDTGQAVLIECSEVSVEGLDIFYSSIGVLLFNCSNIQVQNCSMTECDYPTSIYVFRSNDCTIYNNTIESGSGSGILNVESDGILIKQNVIRGTRYRGISLASSETSIIENVIEGNKETGINAWGGINIVSNNTIRYNQKNGIELDRTSSSTTIQGNLIHGNSQSSISIHESNDNTIVYNTFSFNEEYGIRIGEEWHSDPSSNTKVHHNNFISNGKDFQALDDNNTGSVWDDGVSEGNYWSNYLDHYPQATNDGSEWDIPYRIEGYMKENDRYPLVDPVEGLVIPASVGLIQPVFEEYSYHDIEGDFFLNWTKVEGAVGYTLQQSTDLILGWQNIYVGPETGYLISGRKDGTYYFRVQAFDDDQTSIWSRIERFQIFSQTQEEAQFINIHLLEPLSGSEVSGNVTVIVEVGVCNCTEVTNLYIDDIFHSDGTETDFVDHNGRTWQIFEHEVDTTLLNDGVHTIRIFGKHKEDVVESIIVVNNTVVAGDDDTTDDDVVDDFTDDDAIDDDAIEDDPTDDDDTPGTTTPSSRGVSPLIVTGVFVLTALAASTIFVAGTEVGTYGFFTLLGRLRKKREGESETKWMVLGYVMANPGEHFSELKRILKLENGVLAYHLQSLEKEELIKSRRKGVTKCFYPFRMKVPKTFLDDLSKTETRIYKAITKKPGCTQNDLMSLLSMNQGNLSKYLNRLIDKGIVQYTTDKGVKYYYPQFFRDDGVKLAAQDI